MERRSSGSTVLPTGCHEKGVQCRHGYEILHETAIASDGKVSLKVTTLYAAFARMRGQAAP